MTQDYVRNSRPARKRKPTGRPSAGRRSSQPAFPVFRVILVVALVIGFGVGLYLLKSNSTAQQEAAKPQAAPKPIPIEDQRPAKEKFDYMTLLENKEVPIDLPNGMSASNPTQDLSELKRIQARQQMLEQQRLRAQLKNGTPQTESARASALLTGQADAETDPDQPATQMSAQAAKPAPAKPPLKPQPAQVTAIAAAPTVKPASTEKPTEPTGKVMLQCGAFRAANQAESMKLRLAFQGHSSQIQRSEVNNVGWYKVILGPYASKADAERQRNEMQSKHLVEHCSLLGK